MKKLFLIVIALAMIGGCIMPAGTKDFGQKQDVDKSVEITDLGEVANRINRGMGSYGRGGSWMFSDDFNNYATGHYNSQMGTLALDTTRVLRPGARVSLSMTTGAIIGNYANIQRYMATYPTKMGTELMIMLAPINGNLWTVEIMMNWTRAADLFPYSLKSSIQITCDGTKYTLQLFEDNGGAGAYVTRIDPLKIVGLSDIIPHFIKFTGDFNTEKYGNLWIDTLSFDFSDRAMGHSTPGTAGYGMYMNVEVKLTTLSAIARKIYIGDLIFTKDEP